MFNKPKIAVGAVLACGLILLAGCTPPDAGVTTSVTVNPQTGTVTGVTIGVTVTWHHQKLQNFAMFTPQVTGSELASLDPSQAILNFSLSNATITSTGGAVTVTVTDDDTGVVVGQQTFEYVVSGNGLFAQNPSAVSAWLDQFTAYTNLDVSVATASNMQANSPGAASVTSNATYQGVNYASASGSWTAPPIGGGGGCHTRICPNQ